MRNTLLLRMLLLHLSAVTLIVSLARGFLFLLLGLPFFADLLELYCGMLVMHINQVEELKVVPREAGQGSTVASFRSKKLSSAAGTP